MTNIGGFNPVAYNNTFNQPVTRPNFQGRNTIVEPKSVETAASGNFIFMGLEFLAIAIALGAAARYGIPKAVEAIKNFAGEGGLWKAITEKASSLFNSVKNAVTGGEKAATAAAKEATAEATTTASKTAKKATAKAKTAQARQGAKE